MTLHTHCPIILEMNKNLVISKKKKKKLGHKLTGNVKSFLRPVMRFYSPLSKPNFFTLYVRVWSKDSKVSVLAHLNNSKDFSCDVRLKDNSNIYIYIYIRLKKNSKQLNRNA